MNAGRAIIGKRAFTLLEVLIAIALVLMLGGAMFGFLQSMLATRARTLELAGRQRAAATLIERLETDAQTCVVGDGLAGSGVVGDNARIRLLTRGVMPQLASRGLDDPVALGDLQRVEYVFDDAQQRILAGKSAAGESADLAPLGGTVARVRFRYLDDHRWIDSFDSRQANRLPSAIEVAIWYSPTAAQLARRDAAAQAANGEEFAVTQPSFDEQAFAEADDERERPEPAPDRVRVIVIPDAQGDTGNEDGG